MRLATDPPVKLGDSHQDGSGLADLQVGKRGLPPLERQRREWLLQPSTSDFTQQLVAPLALERGQATLPNLQISVDLFLTFHTVSTARWY